METEDSPYPQRRRTYLRVVTDLLLDDLNTVVQAWEPERSDHYRAQFVQGDPALGLRNILLGMGSLSRAELAGERMEVALN